MTTSADVRIGVYFIIAGVVFGYWMLTAIEEYRKKATRPRLSLIVFTLSWAILCFSNTVQRWDIATRELSTSLAVEAIRAICALTVSWVALEYRGRTTQNDHNTL